MTAPFSLRNLEAWNCMPCGRPLLMGRCVWCGGNRARSARWRFALGTRIKYLKTVGSLDSHARPIGAAIRFHAELARRIHGFPGRLPAVVREWFWIEMGHCLDAPEMMPAGSCVSDVTDLGDGELEAFECQSFFLREPPPDVSPSEPRPSLLDTSAGPA